MSRVQLALNVADLEASVAFYSTLFGVEPHKRRPGYANFAVAVPPLKLVLIEVGDEARGHGTAGALNHLGVEVESSDEVAAGSARLRTAGLAAFDENDTTCCYALQDKVWVTDPRVRRGSSTRSRTTTRTSPPAAVLHDVSGMSDGGCCTSSVAADALVTDAVPSASSGAACCAPSVATAEQHNA